MIAQQEVYEWTQQVLNTPFSCDWRKQTRILTVVPGNSLY